MKTLAAALAALLLPVAAHAGGALQYDTAGNAVGWDSSAPVPYKTDHGNLGAKSNAEAIALVDQLFGQWQAVSTAALQYADAGGLANDVDVVVGNYGTYMGPYGGQTTPLGENAIVFDADGSIFDDLFGAGTGVLGFAGPTFFSDGTGPAVAVGNPIPPGSHIVEGLAFLNGKFIDGIAAPDNPEVSLQMFQAAILHELGHFSGLGHTQIHPLDGFDSVSGTRSGDVSQTETMYPFIGTVDQASLALDDRVALSRLYPVDSFATTTGCLSGRVLRADGAPFDGANVVAHNPDLPSESVSVVTGADALPAHAGTYSLCGLTPGHRYAIEVQEVDVFASGGSRVGPFDPPLPLPGPPEAWNGQYEGSDPALDDPTQIAQALVAAGDTPGFDIRLNDQRFAVRNLPWTAEGFPADASPSALVLADFDGDGKVDLLGAQEGVVPGNQIRFARGQGDGTFAAPVRVDDFPGAVALVAGQFNPGVDAFVDFALVSAGTGELRLYLGNGAGSFAAQPALVPAGTSGAVTLGAGDLDGDGRTDLLYLRREADGTLTVLAELSLGDGTFSSVASAVPAAAGLHLVDGQSLGLGRIVGPSGVDAVFALVDRPALAILAGDGAGHFAAQIEDLSALTSRIGTALALADFDGDGLVDIALPDYAPEDLPPNVDGAYIDILRNHPFSDYSLAARYPVPEPLQGALIAADFDRDGRTDIASAGSFLGPRHPGAKVTFAFGDGHGGVRALAGALADRQTDLVWGLAEFPAALYPGEMQAADLNGDGQIDLVVSDHATAVFGVTFPAQVSVLIAQGLPAERPTRFYTLPPCRLLDTRSGSPLFDGTPRTLRLAGLCGVPATARSLSVNATAIAPGGDGTLQFRAGPLGPVPIATAASFRAGVTRANNAMLQLSSDGAGNVIVTATVANGGSVHLALDVNGYFE